MYLIIMWDCLLVFRGLGLYSLEIESLAQVVNHFVLLSITDISSQSLLRIIIKYMQLKIGLVEFFFMYNHEEYTSLDTLY